MDGAWDRLGVYLGLREDPEAEAKQEAEPQRHWLVRSATWVALASLQLLLCALLFSLFTLVAHLATGGDTSLHAVLADGLRFLAIAWFVTLLIFGVGRWVYWFADRWVR